jgi:peptide/nickel transport system substrate-binding protein
MNQKGTQGPLRRFGKNILKIQKTFSRREWIIYYIGIALLLVSSLSLVFSLNEKSKVAIPYRGGSYTEGIIGTPRFINPVLALTDADRDMVALVYSGLMKRTPDGDVIPDLAETYEISPDGKTYTFTLKNGIKFHDGTPVTSRDVKYTIDLIQNPDIKSPKRVAWEGVTVETPDEKTVVFTLKEEYGAFLDIATVGILPSSLLEGVPSDEFNFTDINTNPIGSGPYRVERVRKTDAGIPTSYALHSFPGYALGQPFIKKFYVRFFANEGDVASALKSGSIDGAGSLSPDTIIENKFNTVEPFGLPRLFALFLNPNQQPIFREQAVITALSEVIDRSQVIESALYGLGTPTYAPVPDTLLGETIAGTSNESSAHIEEATKLLEANGWKKNESGIWEKKKVGTLTFSIATSDTPELTRAVNEIKKEIESFGGQVNVLISNVGVLNQEVIRPRKFDVVFFGQVVGDVTDLFGFWHSSQRTDPGVNITGYANQKVDKILEKLLVAQSFQDKETLIQDFMSTIVKDIPAVFVYSPQYLYVENKKVYNRTFNIETSSADRFQNVQNWYVETQHVWSIFNKE